MTSRLGVRERRVAGSPPRYAIADWEERFGVTAGITGRGSPSGPGFDLGLQSDLPAARVMANWSELRAAIPGFEGVVQGHQVHGVEVRWHERVAGWLRLDGVDGHATATPGLLLTVTVADCIPVYLVAPSRRALALVHAGWRGAAAGILGRAVGQLARHARVEPSDIVVHCGVGVCGDCYQVGPEVLEAFGVRGDLPGPWNIDIRERLKDEATDLGVSEITLSDWCTVHDADRFFSFRQAAGVGGRMVAYLGYPLA